MPAAIRLAEISDTGPDTEREQAYRRRVRPQSDGQQRLMAAIERHNLTIALGPAGTGKTYLAVSAAVSALEAGEVGRIVLTRPAIEAGEKARLPSRRYRRQARALFAAAERCAQ